MALLPISDLLGALRPKRRRTDLPCFGYLAQFDGADALLDAARAARAAGYANMEAYTPIPLHEVSHVLGYKSRLPLMVLCGGILGATVGFCFQYWVSVSAYPMNIGGRPLNSWPSFIIVTFELTILFAALTAVFGMLALNGLPRPNHPVFALESFERASSNRFFLLVLAHDPKFDMERTPEFLAAQSPLSVEEVPNT